MLIPSVAWSALLASGITPRPRSSFEVELVTDDEQSVVASVLRRSEPLKPSHVHALAPRGPRGSVLLVVPAASGAALDAAEAAGVSVIVVGRRRPQVVTGRVLVPGRTIHLDDGTGAAVDVHAVHRPGPRPWGTLTVARLLLAGVRSGQTSLAQSAGITQSRVSQALAGLARDGLVERTQTGDGRSRWQPATWDSLADWWLATYPGPEGLSTYWYGFDTPVAQGRTVVSALLGADVRAAVSGDVAADVLAPWRRPVRAVVYADVTTPTPAIDLTGQGLTPSGPEEATLELVVPADPGVWVTSVLRRQGGDVPVIDGMQVLWDVARAPGSDSDQAAAAVRSFLRAQAAAAPGVGG